MKGFKLDILALALKQVHHDLEILFGRDVPRHDAKIRTVQQNLAQ
jgi:hypothetical protein